VRNPESRFGFVYMKDDGVPGFATVSIEAERELFGEAIVCDDLGIVDRIVELMGRMFLEKCGLLELYVRKVEDENLDLHTIGNGVVDALRANPSVCGCPEMGINIAIVGNGKEAL